MNKILIICAIINALTFTMARISWKKHDKLGAALQHRFASNPEQPTYLIGGFHAQAECTFRKIAYDVLDPHADKCCYLHYQNRGFSVSQTVEAIIRDMENHDGEKARIVTVSLGDHVARYLEATLGDKIEVYAINPCPWFFCIKMHWLILLAVAGPILEVACHLLGWISLLRFVPTPDGFFTPILLADQMWAMVYDIPPNKTERTKGAIYSLCDDYVNNDYVEPYFPSAEAIYIHARHGIVNCFAEYIDAIRKLLRQ